MMTISAMHSPQWMYIWPAYTLVVLVFAALAVWTFARLRAAARRARDTDAP